MTRPDGTGKASTGADGDILPDGMTAVTTTTYHVGPYRYGKLEDAMAEHGRRHPG